MRDTDKKLRPHAAASLLRISSATGMRWAQHIRRESETSVAVMRRPHNSKATQARKLDATIAQVFKPKLEYDHVMAYSTDVH